MPADQEPKVTRRTIVVKDFWKRWRTAKKVVVASGPLPTEDELPSKDGVARIPPRRVAGTTQADLESSRRQSKVVSGVEKSLPRGDRD